MLLALLYLAAVFLAGFSLVSWLKLKLSGVEMLSLSFVFGLALAAPATFLLSWLLGMVWGSIAWILVAACAVFATRRKFRADWEFATWDVVFAIAILFLSTLSIAHNQLDGEKLMVAKNSFGDLMYHLRLINSFAFSANFPPEEPVYSGALLKYHFFFDFFSASLITGGFGMAAAVVVPASFALASFLTLAYSLARRFSGSRWAGVIAVVLIFFSGGWLFMESYQNGQSLEKWSANAHEYYSQNKLGYIFGNIAETAFQAQRTLLAGLAVFAGILLVLVDYYGIFEKKRLAIDPRVALSCGVITGLSVLMNAHMFIALMLTAFFTIIIFSREKIRDLLLFFVPACLLAAPAVLFISLGESSGYPKLNLLWEAYDVPEALIFWIRNLGLFLPLFLLGFALSDRKKQLFYAGALSIFALGNIIQFSWFEFDNYKLFVAFYVVSALYAADLLAMVARRGKLAAAAVAVLVLLATFTGIMMQLDDWVVRYAPFEKGHFALAEWVLNNTPPRSVFLTGTGHTDPLPTLTGRRIVEGLAAWVGPHGYDYGARQDDVRAVYSGAENTSAVIAKYGINYVVVGPFETSEFGAGLNEGFFESSPLFEKVYDAEPDGRHWEIYRVR